MKYLMHICLLLTFLSGVSHAVEQTSIYNDDMLDQLASFSVYDPTEFDETEELVQAIAQQETERIQSSWFHVYVMPYITEMVVAVILYKQKIGSLWRFLVSQ
jgi:hypothetical protein